MSGVVPLLLTGFRAGLRFVHRRTALDSVLLPCYAATMTTAIYLRISTDDQTLDSQSRPVREYCQRRGWTDVTVYEDIISGSKDSRPGLNTLLSDVRGGLIERVVCYKLDRLGRSLTHLALLLDELTRNAVPVICVTQGIDTSSDNPVGKLQLGVLMAVAEFERSMIRERTRAGLAAARARGVRLGGVPQIIHWAPKARELFNGGMKHAEIAKTLGVKRPSVYRALQLVP